MVKIKAIFLDVDNTLLDFNQMKRLCVKSAVDAMLDAGLDIPRKKAIKQVFEVYDAEGIEYKNVLQDFLKNALGKIDYRILAKGVIAYRKMRDGILMPYPEVKSTIIKLKKKGFKIAILSDAQNYQLWMRLCATGIDDLSDVVVSAEDVGAEKPNPKIFQLAMKKLKVKPEECLMVGDMPGRDIKGAKDLLIKSVLVMYGSENISKNYVKDMTIKPDFKINYFRELLPLISKLNS